MRLIDADAKELEQKINVNFGSATRFSMKNILKEAPTVDAVPVVRCCECKFLNVWNREDIYAHCPKTNTVFLPFKLDARVHFCSYGERKEGAD